MASAPWLWKSAVIRIEFARPRRSALKRDFDDGPERHHRFPAYRRAMGGRRGRIAMVLLPARPGRRRRRAGFCGWRRRSFADRPDIGCNGLAGAAPTDRARPRGKLFDSGVRGADAHHQGDHGGIDLAEPELFARRLRQAGAGMAGHPPRHLRHPQRILRSPDIAIGVAGGRAEHYRPARLDHRRARTRSPSCLEVCG